MEKIQLLKKKLKEHSLYKNINTVKDVQIFMEFHIYAVWDFMSILKSLQKHLINTSIPWTPNKNSKVIRLINEIILDEETDLNDCNIPKSHFEMYIDSMKEVGADVTKINHLLTLIESGVEIKEALKEINIDPIIEDFVLFSFSVINTNKAHLIASLFTYGREDIIPDMFLEILNSKKSYDRKFQKFKFYLKRHIELDANNHGPASFEMLYNLCSDNSDLKWKEVIEIAEKALEKRLSLWDSINDKLITNAYKL